MRTLLTIVIVFIATTVFAEGKWILPDDTIVTEDKRFYINGESYGRGDFQNPDKIAEMGAKKLVVEGKENAFYKHGTYSDTISGDTVTRTYQLEPCYTVAQVKEFLWRQVKKEAMEELEKTNLYIFMKVEDNSSVPQDVIDSRQAIKSRALALRSQIKNETEYEALVNLYRTGLDIPSGEVK